MNLNQALDAIKWNKGRYAKEAVEVILRNQEDALPYLLKFIDPSIKQNRKLAEDENYMPHIYALYILAKLREEKAFPYIIKLLKQPEEDIDIMLGDLGVEDGARWLLSTYNGDLEVIKQLVEDVEVEPFMRSQGLIAMGLLVLWEKEDRRSFIDYCKHIMETQDEEVLISEVANLASELCLKEIRDEVKALFINDRVDTFYIRMEDVLPVLRLPVEEVLDKTKSNQHFQYIEDIQNELKGLICFGLDNMEKKWLPPISDEYFKVLRGEA